MRWSARLRASWMGLGALLVTGVSWGAPLWAADIDWAAVEKEATDLLSAYVQVDTSNPPGNEIAAARFFAERFRAAGISTETFESEPGRGSVLARLRGSGGARPIILLNHLDVVPANPAEWAVPPFAGTVRDGYVIGRGALDTKGLAVVEAMAMLLSERLALPHRRDLIFLGTADEEAGGKLGAGWMVANHFDKFEDAEFVINEGGGILPSRNGRLAYMVAVAEKTPCWLRLTATGDAGHGSAPPAATAVTRIVGALGRIDRWQPAVRVTPEAEAYFAALAAVEGDTRGAIPADLGKTMKDARRRAEFLQDPRRAALVRNTITPTVLTGSLKTNVIPHAASAELDCRLLPGENVEAFVSMVKRTIADPSVGVEVTLNFPSSSSPADTTLFRALETVAGAEGAGVVPSLLTGFTDSHYFRERGIASYGFAPFVLPPEEHREHGVNERLSTANLRDGIRRLIDLLRVMSEDGPNDRPIRSPD